MRCAPLALASLVALGAPPVRAQERPPEPAQPAAAPPVPRHVEEGYALIFVPLLVVGLLAPSDMGAVVSGAERDETRFALGWSWQVPIPPLRNGNLTATHHHLIGGFDYLAGPGEVHVQGRFGYRCTWRHAFVGLAPAVDHTGWSWSPEAGIKLAHLEPPDRDLPYDLSLHLLVRGNVAPEVGALRTVAIFLGWSLL